MASPTKLELTQRLVATGKELEAARLRIAELEGDVAALKAINSRVNAKIANTVRTRSVYQPSEAQLEVRARMAAARDEAMRTGRSVKVQ